MTRLADIRKRLQDLSGDDLSLLFAYRRKVAKELTYDERSKPMVRRVLKTRKMNEQGGICPICQKPLPKKNAVLDRHSAIDGYTMENTRLICSECDHTIQAQTNL